MANSYFVLPIRKTSHLFERLVDVVVDFYNPVISGRLETRDKIDI